MKCVNCKFEFIEGDWVVEEVVGSETLPLVHKECLETPEYTNAVRGGAHVFRYTHEYITCPICKGVGKLYFRANDPTECATCDGTGRAVKVW